MKFSALDYAQRQLNYAIVDEVDSILIDEARTPLIISGQGETSSEKYKSINEVIPRLRKDEHYVVDEKEHSVTLTDDGIDAAQKLLGDLEPLRPGQPRVAAHPEPVPPRAHALQARRELHGHRRRQGPHHRRVHRPRPRRVVAGPTASTRPSRPRSTCAIQEETRTMATITFQNLFRLYKKLSGMTGTADTEAEEFHKTYKLDVVTIPTNKPIMRTDYEDLVYKTEREKFTAVVNEIMERHEKGRPVLVGTTSVEKSDRDREDPQEEGHPARRPQRQAARERGVRRRAGRSQRRHHRLDQHGRSRHRHHPRRQPRDAREARVQGAEPRRGRRDGRVREGRREVRGLVQEGRRRGPRGRRSPHRRHRAPRVTPHRQPAPRPRRSPGRPGLVALLPLARRRPHAHLRRRPGEVAHGAHGHARRRAHRAPVGHEEHPRTRRARSKSATSTSARTCSSTTT